MMSTSFNHIVIPAQAGIQEHDVSEHGSFFPAEVFMDSRLRGNDAVERWMREQDSPTAPFPLSPALLMARAFCFSPKGIPE